jgi:hypothetical protein
MFALGNGEAKPNLEKNGGKLLTKLRRSQGCCIAADADDDDDD